MCLQLLLRRHDASDTTTHGDNDNYNKTNGNHIAVNEVTAYSNDSSTKIWVPSTRLTNTTARTHLPGLPGPIASYLSAYTTTILHVRGKAPILRMRLDWTVQGGLDGERSRNKACGSQERLEEEGIALDHGVACLLLDFMSTSLLAS